jgi:hypothetical protein
LHGTGTATSTWKAGIAMMTREDLESYLIRMELDFDEVDESLWVIKPGEGAAPLVLSYSPPVILLRMKVMDLPESGDDARLAHLYRRLLELNAMDIVHGSYGIEAQEVVLSDAMELDTLDFSELRSSYESLTMAASSHTPELVAIVEQSAGAQTASQG